MLRLFLQSLVTGVEGIARNKFRAFLTSLGIIFGVASVITMLSIGKGAEKQILDQLKFLGTNNLIIRAVVDQDENKKANETETTGEKETPKFSPGLTRKDGEEIAELFPHVEAVSMETHLPVQAIKGTTTMKVMLVGQSADFQKVNDFTMAKGNFFTAEQLEKAQPVCILGSAIAKRLFYAEDPLNKTIKCGNEWLKIVGVATEKKLSEEQIQSLRLRNFGNDVYIPLKTLLLRFKDRSVTKDEAEFDFGEGNVPANPNYHQLDRIVVKTDDTERLNQLADLLSRYFLRRHNLVEDFEIEVPMHLMRQKEKTQDIFSFVLISIASISLLVGGIGIMNIMLASVMERTREIGIRLAVGATKRDITLLFLGEAVTLSIGGGLLGIFLGFVLSEGISRITEIPTVITLGSVILSFSVAATVGIIFGWYPASQAAKQDPVVSLRYE